MLASCSRRLLKNASWPRKRASGRSRPNVANAASISRLVLAFRAWICNPIARAADSTSRNVVSVFAAAGDKTKLDRVFGDALRRRLTRSHSIVGAFSARAHVLEDLFRYWY